MPDLTTKDALLEKMAEQTALLKENIQSMVTMLAPVGSVQAYAGSTTPDGWLLCDGSAVSRTDYASLFDVIGTTYGAGDGTDTFNLPDLVDKFVQGNATAGTVKSAGLPNITGSIQTRTLNDSTTIVPDYFGAFGDGGRGSAAASINAALQSTSRSVYVMDFDASRSSAIYGNSTTVQPPALTMRYIIKY